MQKLDDEDWKGFSRKRATLSYKLWVGISLNNKLGKANLHNQNWHGTGSSTSVWSLQKHWQTKLQQGFNMSFNSWRNLLPTQQYMMKLIEELTTRRRLWRLSNTYKNTGTGNLFCFSQWSWCSGVLWLGCVTSYALSTNRKVWQNKNVKTIVMRTRADFSLRFWKCTGGCSLMLAWR